MESRIEIGWLFDFYGPLLTERQREMMTLWCEDDLSLSEIGSEMDISRQAVSDALHSAQARLEEYEKKLGLLRRYRRITDGLQRCLTLLDAEESDTKGEVRKVIRELLSEEET